MQRVPHRRWQVGRGRVVELGAQSCLMGILNVTPDSFSDGGRFDTVEAAVGAALAMVEDGAAIIDVGGESTRPGGAPVDAEEEQRRVLPVIEALAARSDCLISIDTYRASTARLALAAGAHIVNDVWGAQKEPEIAQAAAEFGAGLCLMHTSREREVLADVIADQTLFLERSIGIARAAGVADEAIMLDPGFGFGKDADVNYRLLARFDELHALGFPWLVGTSRKRFVRGVQPRGDRDQDVATAATSALLRERGAAVFRVHDVALNRAALAVVDAVLVAGNAKP
ncbi:dihydropteroate synthase [Consotaella aegiceratis]|uniref:dihydropteroate synthase n=1 Tax=Consotaella aegiceratis TaxID=3097961 RepID=UPI002F41BCB8